MCTYVYVCVRMRTYAYVCVRMRTYVYVCVRACSMEWSTETPKHCTLGVCTLDGVSE